MSAACVYCGVDVWGWVDGLKGVGDVCRSVDMQHSYYHRKQDNV